MRGEAAEEERRKKRLRMYGEGRRRAGVDMVEGAVRWMEGGYRCQCHLWWTGQFVS